MTSEITNEVKDEVVVGEEIAITDNTRNDDVGDNDDDGDDDDGDNDDDKEEEEAESDLVEKAVRLYEDDKLLEAGRILASVASCRLEKKHNYILKKAKLGEALVEELKSTDLTEGKETDESSDESTDESTDDSTDGKWVIHGVSKGAFPTLTAHKLVKNTTNENAKASSELKARVETPIDNSMLSPFISVLNETELYETWLPSWNTPKFQIRRCDKLSQTGRCSQVIIVTIDLPWPMASREIVLLADAFDDIDENGDIAIRLETLKTGDEDGLVPPPEKSVVRIDVNGGFLIRKCPSDHPALLLDENETKDEKKDSKQTTTSATTNSDKILITFAATMNPKLKLLPQSFLNFLVKVAFGIAWAILLKIAREVKEGKREDHHKAIQSKREVLYDWVELRLQSLLAFNNETQITGI